MSLACVDGPTVEAFVDDTKSFDRWVDEQFNSLDVESKGALSRKALEHRPGKFGSMEFELQSKDEIRNIYDVVFEKFDINKSGTINRQKFGDLMKEIMLAKARSIGKSPILVILQGDSLLMRAVQRLSPNQ